MKALVVKMVDVDAWPFSALELAVARLHEVAKESGRVSELAGTIAQLDNAVRAARKAVCTVEGGTL